MTISANVQPRYQLYNQVNLTTKLDGAHVGGSPKTTVDQKPASSYGTDFGVFLSNADAPPIGSGTSLKADGQSAGFVNLLPGAEQTSIESRLKLNVETVALEPAPPKRTAQAIAYGFSCGESVALFQGERLVEGFFNFHANGVIGNGVSTGPVKLFCKLGRSYVIATYNPVPWPNPGQSKWTFSGVLYKNNLPTTVNEEFVGQQLPAAGKGFICDEMMTDQAFLQSYCNNGIGGWQWLSGNMNAFAENGNVTGGWPQASGEMTYGSTAMILGVT